MNLRSGFSTSACAAAAACAAIEELHSGFPVTQVMIMLYRKGPFPFQARRIATEDNSICYAVIKDAGDDPDVTNGIEICVSVSINQTGKNRILGGAGVGIVMRPGLYLDVGEAAINPGSKRLILNSVSQYCAERQISCSFNLVISVPMGDVIAKQTMNEKLGIHGGISILGTDGFVKPYSKPAFKTAIAYELRYAEQNHWKTVGFATGKRSSAFLQTAYSQAYIIDAGDELEYPLTLLERFSFQEVLFGGMIGKFAKTATGQFQTHVDQGKVDFNFLSDLAAQIGASVEICEQIRSAVTAHQVQSLLQKMNLHIEPTLATLTLQQLRKKIDPATKICVCIYSLNGNLLGKAQDQ